MGDPSGIGPEVIIKALSDRSIQRSSHITVIGDYFVIDKIKKALKLKPEFSLIDLSNVPQNRFVYGKTSASFGRASIEYIDRALDMIGRGDADCMVTAPVNKSSIREGAIRDFQGHTEYIAGKTSSQDVGMMFVGGKMRVSLVTRHLALKEVPRNITEDKVYSAIMLTAKYLKLYFGIKEPRMAVAGLNPHAGECGLFGDEEAKSIIPAIDRAREDFKFICGPISADAVFYGALKGQFDAVVAMYHDQALAPFKLLHFTDGVNLTLGLPFVRTSPDHGTAFDIAGKGVADARSMKEAILLAAALSNSKTG